MGMVFKQIFTVSRRDGLTILQLDFFHINFTLVWLILAVELVV